MIKSVLQNFTDPSPAGMKLRGGQNPFWSFSFLERSSAVTSNRRLLYCHRFASGESPIWARAQHANWRNLVEYHSLPPFLSSFSNRARAKPANLEAASSDKISVVAWMQLAPHPLSRFSQSVSQRSVRSCLMRWPLRNLGEHTTTPLSKIKKCPG